MRILKLTALMLGLWWSAYAQATIRPTGPVQARAGETVTVQVALTGATATGPAAMQFSFAAPTGWTLNNPAGAATGRQLTCALPTAPICTVWMMSNTVPHPNGQVMTVQVAVPTTAAPGNYNLGLTAPIAATLSGSAYTLTVGSPHTIKVLHKADINSDGALTVDDALAISQQAVGLSSCTADQNADGRCDAIDIQLVVNAILAGP